MTRGVGRGCGSDTLGIFAGDLHSRLRLAIRRDYPAVDSNTRQVKIKPLVRRAVCGRQSHTRYALHDWWVDDVGFDPPCALLSSGCRQHTLETAIVVARECRRSSAAIVCEDEPGAHRL